MPNEAFTLTRGQLDAMRRAFEDGRRLILAELAEIQKPLLPEFWASMSTLQGQFEVRQQEKLAAFCLSMAEVQRELRESFTTSGVAFEKLRDGLGSACAGLSAVSLAKCQMDNYWVRLRAADIEVLRRLDDLWAENRAEAAELQRQLDDCWAAQRAAISGVQSELDALWHASQFVWARVLDIKGAYNA
jgi:hypothetical protein